MNGFEAWRVDPGFLWDRLMLGIELFGPYADWLWAAPALWAITVISLWAYLAFQQRRSDRAYLAYASRHLPMLRRIAKHRAQEVVYSRRLGGATTSWGSPD